MQDRQLATPLLGIVSLALLGFALKGWVDPLVTGSSAIPGTASTIGDVALGLAGAGAALLFLSRDPAWAISIGLGLEVFNGNWPLVPVSVPLDRLLIAVGLLGLFLRCRRMEDAFGGQPRAVHGMLLLTAVYALFSSIFSNTIQDSASFYGLVDQFGFLPFVLFAVAPAVFPDERRRRILLGTLTVVGAYLAYTSILGHLGPRSLVWPSYIVDPHIGIHADRARGPFIAARR